MSNVEESLETQARIGALRCEGGPHSPTGGLLRRLADEIERLRAELSKHQESEFHPDWSMLEATRSSLREHQKMVRALRAEVAALKKDADRYRWLRSSFRVARWDVQYWTGEFWVVMYGDAMDKQIDAALGKE